MRASHLALLALAAAAALAPAPARAEEPIFAEFAAVYKTAIPACADVLVKPSPELVARAKACWGPVDASAAAAPTTCPSPECRAHAADLGLPCWLEYTLATGGAF